jgi:mannose-1-phosphate guanylyltransferase
MNIVLLSGGSGKRLWPLSNEVLSKQFLKLLKDPKGNMESMVQRVFRMIKHSQPDADIFVSTNKSQADSVLGQVGCNNLILEPCRRDTFPAIVLAAAYLKFVKKLTDDEAMIVCPIDAFAEYDYYNNFTEMKRIINNKDAKIALMGVVPTYPSSKYGYLLCGDNNAVTGFTEKPTEKKAESLIASGALWNCGVFAVQIGYILEKASNYIDIQSYEQVLESYETLPKISFDYEIVEKESSIKYCTYDGIWKDLGTWNTLTEEISDSEIGKDIIISECKNTHVFNMLDKPIIVSGLNDSIVVASYDGVLVCSKAQSSFIKPLAEELNTKPMYEKTGWGSYHVLDYKDNVNASMVKRLNIVAGKSIKKEQELDSTFTISVISGKGILTVADKDNIISKGDVFAVSGEDGYEILAATDMEYIEVEIGNGEETNEILHGLGI